MSELLVEVRDGVGRLTLNRPRQINALSLQMLVDLREVLSRWADDPDVERVELDGAGERGLCAGADVRALRESVLAGGDPMEYLDAEYPLDRLIAEYPKPYRAAMAGIVMGGGLGLSAHASERVLTPESRLAMPETIIGIFPDVGVLWELSRAPGELGTHLAMTGRTIGAADGLLVGLADRCDGDPGQGVLEDQRAWIDECYACDDAAEVVGRLEQHHSEEARAAASDLRRRCPLSVAATLEAIRRAAGMATVAEVLDQDRTMINVMARRPDFVEGVRAQLVDRDQNPRWQHACIEDVTGAEVLACFAP